MTAEQRERWAKIEGFAFDAPDAVITFEAKLVRETSWTRDRARRAIAEYRRFLLLAAAAGHPVSPSPAVDDVWHLHLLYTRSYWNDLCPNVLGFDLHHEPASGTAADRTKLDDWYARTLASYAAIFDVAPPEDLWPAKPTARSSRRVESNDVVVLPRTLWRTIAASLILSAAALAAIILTLSLRAAE